jgi:hypothetical protein
MTLRRFAGWLVTLVASVPRDSAENHQILQNPLLRHQNDTIVISLCY